jgi:hypothetical protein
LSIFGVDAPGTQAELKPPVRQKINRRSLTRPERDDGDRC